MNDRAATLLAGRRERMTRALGEPLPMPQGERTPLTEAARAHLIEDALDLYWNELEWEHITEEEATEGAPLSELTFPGLLAFVRGLLLVRVKEDALAPAEPRPEVVEKILEFLAQRVLELEESLSGPSDADEAARLGEELRLTDRLVDLVLYLYHGLDDDAIERVEQGAIR